MHSVLLNIVSFDGVRLNDIQLNIVSFNGVWFTVYHVNDYIKHIILNPIINEVSIAFLS